jgi:hypothetical protein
MTMDFFIPIFASLLFFLAKIIEMKYVDKETKAIKFMVRDTILVFLITCASVYLYSNFFNTIQGFMGMVTNTKVVPVPVMPEIFTDSPGF